MHTNIPSNSQKTLLGPINELLPMSGMPLKGALTNTQMPVLKAQGILIEGHKITAIGPYLTLKDRCNSAIASGEISHSPLPTKMVALPGFIDAHTHICFGGSRAKDYTLRNSGASYLEIAQQGGGIWDTVTQTRAASEAVLTQNTIKNANRHLLSGVTTIEVKSGYAGNVKEELKMLRAITKANQSSPADLISCCLAAHIFPKNYKGTPANYLAEIVRDLFPILVAEGLTQRVDAFIEQTAFTPTVIAPYLKAARRYGFSICIHADQFTPGGSQVAIAHKALSADHLEASTEKEILALAASNTIAMALPGASMGLGCGYTPARKLLDAGAALAIGSDWNPGSAPMGHLLLQAAVLGAAEKLSHAEVFSGITHRAAAALNLKDRGQLKAGFLADLIFFQTADYQEILYQQGMMLPQLVYKSGVLVKQ